MKQDAVLRKKKRNEIELKKAQTQLKFDWETKSFFHVLGLYRIDKKIVINYTNIHYLWQVNFEIEKKRIHVHRTVCCCVKSAKE